MGDQARSVRSCDPIMKQDMFKVRFISTLIDALSLALLITCILKLNSNRPNILNTASFLFPPFNHSNIQ